MATSRHHNGHSITATLARKHFVATEAEVESLAQEQYRGADIAAQGASTYLRVLVAGCQAKVGRARRGLALRKVFDEATGHMRSDAGVATTTVGTLVLAGGFPRRIELTRVTKRGGCEVRAGDAPCDDGGAAPPSTATWIYDGARYVPAKEPLKK